MNKRSLALQIPSRSAHWLMAAFLLLWCGLTGLLSLNGFFAGVPGQPPINMLMSMLLTLGLFTLVYRKFSGFRRYVLTLDLRLLIMLHSWRMLGLGFIMLHTQDRLPALFAYVAGLGDALTAIMAVVLAYSLFAKPLSVMKKTVWRWNTFGLVDFILAVTLGVLTRSEAPLATAAGVGSDLMTVFPFAMIPGFAVQVFALIHIIIYLQLLNGIDSTQAMSASNSV